MPLHPSKLRARRRLAVTSIGPDPRTGRTRLSVRRPGKRTHVSLHDSPREAMGAALALGCEGALS